MRTMTYNVESYLKDSVAAYLSLLPQGTRLKSVSTPFLASSLGHDVCSPVREGPSLQCPWCRGAFPKSAFRPMEEHKKRGKTAGGIEDPTTPEPPSRGALADKAASVLMKVLYAARYARFDLLCAVAR